MFFKPKNNNSQDRRAKLTEKNQKVYSYYTASKVQKERFEKSNLQDRYSPVKYSSLLSKNVIWIILSLVILIIFTYIITLSTSPNIRYDESIDYNSAENYKKYISGILKDDYKNYFRFSLQSEELEKLIKDKFIEVDEVSVQTSILGRHPLVNLRITPALAVLIQENGKSLIINQNGKLAADINNSSMDTKKLSTINNQSGILYDVGDQLFKPTEIEMLNTISYQLRNSQKGQSDLLYSYILPETPREIRLIRAGYYVKFSLDDSGAEATQQYGAMRAIEDKIKSNDINRHNEYIDVRIGDKVYIK